VGTTYYQDVQVRDYTEGQLAIDLFDVKTHAPVWHGRATMTITESDRDTPAETLNEIVAEVFAEYPPS